MMSRLFNNRAGGLLALAVTAALVLIFITPGMAAGLTPPKFGPHDYRQIGPISSRDIVWVLAQMHLWFAAFVLAVPMFVLIIEVIGITTKQTRYDQMAYEFIKISVTAFSLTSIVGGVFLLALVGLYPGLMRYLGSVFKGTMVYYAVFFCLESMVLYAYYYGWHRLQGGWKKWGHVGLGLLLNLVGTAIMFVANGWLTFMMSPAGLDLHGVFQGDSWAALNNVLWHPINLHRIMANLAYGGSIVGAYSAYRFLASQSDQERANYDWMGYSANFIAIAALLPLPFAGYYLAAEIYAFSQQMGITLMGGIFGWLFIIQAVLIGALFLSANYYLWCAMNRSDGGKRYYPYIKYIAIVLVGSFLVWFTPHTLILSGEEAQILGGPYHKYLGPLGIMPAKNMAVNFMILATAVSFLFYRRANRVATVAWAKAGNWVQVALFLTGVINISVLGIYYGYFTNTVYKIAAAVPQVMTTLLVIVIAFIIEWRMFKGAKQVGKLHWGRIPAQSQYALILLGVSFTWLMGLMGYVRSGIRQHWHVYGVVRDTSPDAYTPSLGYAANVVSVAAILFMALIIFVFWLGQSGGHQQNYAALEDEVKS